MIETSIYSSIKTLASGRVYPMILPENVSMPAIVYQRISSDPIKSLDGESGIDYVRIQISTWGASYKSAKETSAAVRSALNASSMKITIDNETDDYDPETKHYRVISDFLVWQK